MAITQGIITNLLSILDNHKEDGGLVHYIDEEEILEIKNNKPKTVETDYNRSWYKLNKPQKINRLIVYAQKLTKEYGLTAEQQVHVKQLFMNVLTLDHSDDIEYDSTTGQILKIKNLQRSMDGKNEFYITSSGKIKSPFLISLNTMVPLTLNQLMTASGGMGGMGGMGGTAAPVLPAVVKKKIVVKKKVCPA